MRVGILGGAFNPPHLGHLICAQEATWRLELDVVRLVPVGEAPHRAIEQDPGREARLEMCRLAVGTDERLDVLRIEVDRDGPSYTADTLQELDDSRADEHVLILGSDQAAALPEWRAPERVLALATVAVAERDGARREQVREALSKLAAGEAVRFFDMPRIDISSTHVRRRAASGRPIRYLVPDAVAAFIAERGLYRTASPVTAA